MCYGALYRVDLVFASSVIATLGVGFNEDVVWGLIPILSYLFGTKVRVLISNVLAACLICLGEKVHALHKFYEWLYFNYVC